MNEIEKINIPITEVKEVFEFLEAVQELFHQPMYYQDSEKVETFAKENYKQIEKLYYDTVWNWLPKEEQNHYKNR